MKNIIIAILICHSFLINVQQYQDIYIHGINKMENGHYVEALSEFSNVIKINNEFSDAYNKRATCYMILGDHKKALSDFDKALEINLNFISAYYNRGLIKKEMNLYLQAIEDFDSALKLNNNLKYAYYNRALCKLRLTDIENACKDLSISADLGIENAAEIYKYTCEN